MSLHIIPITLGWQLSRCVSSYPGWWCCRTLPPRSARRYKTPGATPPSPGTGWIRPGGRRPSDPAGPSSPVRSGSGALWRWAGCRPTAPQSHTAKQHPEQIPTEADDCYFNVGLIKSGSKEAGEFKKLIFSSIGCLYTAPLVISLTVWEELFKVVMQDATRTGLCTQQIFQYNKCWFFSDSYLELIDVVWRVVCMLIEPIWLWGKCSKVFQKYIVNSAGSALKKTLAMCFL